MRDAVFATRLREHRVPPARAMPGLADDVATGLFSPPRWLPPKYFYDARGSALFEAICDTPEYYPMRAEAALLTHAAERIVEHIAPGHIVEFGSGSSRKTRHLLDACARLGMAIRYWPFEVSEFMLRETAHALLEAYDWLTIDAMVGDYTAGLSHLPLVDDHSPRLFVFLGGTLGNFEPAEAAAFLAEIRELMRPGDGLLLGLDRVKDIAVMEAAYDDAAGHTAAFNRNVLAVINRELNSDFPLDAYRHRAFFCAEASRIEMHLVADYSHCVHVEALGRDLHIEAGESIRTEISRKFTRAMIDELLGQAGLVEAQHFEGEPTLFSLVLAVRH